MIKLSEEALAYEPTTTKNITELESVDVNIDIQERTGTKKDGDVFTYKYIVVNGEEYRVGSSILKQLKEQLNANPQMTKFKVTKTGQGMGTEYTVIPLGN